MNLVPRPSFTVAHTCLPCASMIDLPIGRRTPLPCGLVVKNVWNIHSASSTGSPAPVFMLGELANLRKHDLRSRCPFQHDPAAHGSCVVVRSEIVVAS